MFIGDTKLHFNLTINILKMH